ncbi:MAG TPA: hypothetical protein VJW20_16530 [Candidatus Angelobacter sp.]|nr:hypothetical protein [Candidatus Angelobacter sp.]
MSAVFSATTPIQLNWIKSRIKGRYELIANGPILGSLQRVGFWKSVTHAEFKGKAWSFQHCGYTTTKIMEEPGARLVAQFKPNWLGGGWLSFNDGERFQLIAKGFWQPVWSWLNAQGQKLLEVAPNEKCVRLTGASASHELNSSQNRLPVLIMFSWHQILQTNDDAAAVAAISVAAG